MHSGHSAWALAQGPHGRRCFARSHRQLPGCRLPGGGAARPTSCRCLPPLPPDVNYLDVDLDRWQALARYGGPNAARLAAVKARYDPDDFFRHPWSVPLRAAPPCAAAAAEDAAERARHVPAAQG